MPFTGQYPLPHWVPKAGARKAVVGINNPRFAHLPVIRSSEKDGLEVLRSGADSNDALDRLREYDEEVRDWGKHHPYASLFVVSNRLGALHLHPTAAPMQVGLLERRLWTHGYEISDRIVRLRSRHGPDAETTPVPAQSINALTAELQAEIDRLRQLREDGWELVAFSDQRILVDTRRPVERLKLSELPDTPEQWQARQERQRGRRVHRQQQRENP